MYVWEDTPYAVKPTVAKDLSKRKRLKTEIGYLKLGDLEVATIPGEIYPELVLGKVQDPADKGADVPNLFVYAAHQDAGEYLRNSGGPSRNADRRQIFIIRADGSVVSRQYLAHTLWSSSEFDRQPMYPGDTIVVPEAINRTSVLRGLTDWSAVFSQFALGAAAIQVIKFTRSCYPKA